MASFGRGEERRVRGGCRAEPSLFLSTSGPIMVHLTPDISVDFEKKIHIFLHQSVASRLPCVTLGRRVRVCHYLVGVGASTPTPTTLFSLFSPTNSATTTGECCALSLLPSLTCLVKG